MSDTNFRAVDDDFSLDDIADLPKFVSLPDGSYTVAFPDGIVKKTINEGKENEHPAYELKMVVEEVHEITAKQVEGEEPPKPGDVASMLYMVDNEFGAGKFKDILKAFAKASGLTKVGEISKAAVGTKGIVVIKGRMGKNENADKRYMDIHALGIL